MEGLIFGILRQVKMGTPQPSCQKDDQRLVTMKPQVARA